MPATAFSVHSAPRPWSWPIRGGGLAVAVQASGQPRLRGQRALQKRRRDQPTEPRDRARAPFQSLGMRELGGVVVHAPQIANEDRRDRVGAVIGIPLDDLVPERAQQLERLLHRPRGVSVQAPDDAEGDPARAGHAQARGRARGGARERHGRRIRLVAVARDATHDATRDATRHGARNAARDDVQKQCRVRDAPSEDAVDRQPMPGTYPRRDRHPATLRLESE
jgi:hypothetical protein